MHRLAEDGLHDPSVSFRCFAACGHLLCPIWPSTARKEITTTRSPHAFVDSSEVHAEMLTSSFVSFCRLLAEPLP